MRSPRELPRVRDKLVVPSPMCFPRQSRDKYGAVVFFLAVLYPTRSENRADKLSHEAQLLILAAVSLGDTQPWSKRYETKRSDF